MSLKTSLFLVHIAFWIAMCTLAYYFKPIAGLGLGIIFSILDVPEMVFSKLLGMSRSNPVVLWAMSVYHLSGLVMAVLMFAVGLSRFKRGHPAVLLWAVHLSIVALGLFTQAKVGSINFRFGLLGF